MGGRSRRQPEQQVCNSDTYNVQPGDNLWNIAESATGDGRDYSQIAGDNPQIADPNLIHPGDQLDVSGLCGEEAEDEVEVGPEGQGGEQTTAPPPGGEDGDGGAPPPPEVPTPAAEQGTPEGGTELEQGPGQGTVP
jgi:nucleoid-associated protein YgaU